MFSRFSRLASLLALSLLIFPLSSFQVDARWAVENDANVEVLNSKEVVKVHKDGTATVTFEIDVKPLNETGRRNLSTRVFTYDASRETLKILEAETRERDSGNIFPVKKEKIEDKPLASDKIGFRNQHQILIPFQQVTVGSILHFKLERHLFKPSMPNYFSAFYDFNDREGFLWKNSEVTIESKIPLYYKINDPRNILNMNVKEDPSNDNYIYKLKLTKPLIEMFIAESDNSYFDPETVTYASFSTEKDWERMGKFFGEKYHTLLMAPLPEALDRIRDAGSKVEDETACIDTVVSHLIKKITYLGNWDSAEGQMIPRTLEEIIKSGYGDCKDHSLCLAAILNKLGYKATVASVFRDPIYLEKNIQPCLTQFNHVIVKVVGPSGKVYWIDPTNKVSMAGGIFPDIADRPVLVRYLEQPAYERIPPIDYKHAKTIHEQTITLEGESVKTVGSVYFEGESAQDITEELVTESPSVVSERLIKTLLSDGGDPINSTLNFIPKLKLRIVQPLKATFSFEEDNRMTLTNLGYTFALKGHWYKSYVKTSQKDEGALHVEHPRTIVKKKIFKNVKAANLDSLAFSIETPWLNAKRELFFDGEDIIVIETIEIIKSMISAKDLKSKEFDNLRKTLRKYCSEVAIIFSK